MPWRICGPVVNEKGRLRSQDVYTPVGDHVQYRPKLARLPQGPSRHPIKHVKDAADKVYESAGFRVSGHDDEGYRGGDDSNITYDVWDKEVNILFPAQGSARTLSVSDIWLTVDCCASALRTPWSVIFASMLGVIESSR